MVYDWVSKNLGNPIEFIAYYETESLDYISSFSSQCSGTSCKKNCASEALDCYILDNNGFIVISERHEHTGKFFGEIDGTIMDSLVQDRIYRYGWKMVERKESTLFRWWFGWCFRKVTVTDYQGTCSPQESHQSAAPRTFSQSIWTRMVNFLWSMAFGLNLENLWRVGLALAGESTKPLDGSMDMDVVDGVESFATDDAVAERKEEGRYWGGKLRSCEKKTDLYILQPDRLNTSGQSNPLKGKLTNCHDTGCERCVSFSFLLLFLIAFLRFRPFSVQKIRHTNLILLVVDTLCPCGSKRLSIDPIEALTEPGACIARRERLYRRRPGKCINYHPEEMEIKYCGSASVFYSSLIVVASLVNLTF